MSQRNYIIGYFFILMVSCTYAIFNDIPTVYPFEIVSLETVLKKYPKDVWYQEFRPEQEVNFKPLGLVPPEFGYLQPNRFTFDKTGVLTILHGRAWSAWGRVIIDEKYIVRNLEWPALCFTYQLNLLNEERYQCEHVRKVSGRVAVLTCIAFGNYSHCLNDILGRLAMLEIMGIDYDWIYVPYDGHSGCRPFMKQILQAWGIDLSKIIEPFGEFTCIEADELIVPSFPVYMKPTSKNLFRINTDLLSVKMPMWLIDFYNEKFVPIAQQKGLTDGRFAKRVFISRQDSGTRVLYNEDEVFKLFEACGFKKYVMTDLTFLEQIALFHNAEIVVGAHGAALINCMFCRPGTTMIEIFQERCDAAYSYLAQSIGLDYIPVQTVPFNTYDIWGGNPTVAALNLFEDLITTLRLQ